MLFSFIPFAISTAQINSPLLTMIILEVILRRFSFRIPFLMLKTSSFERHQIPKKKISTCLCKNAINGRVSFIKDLNEARFL